jgi:hypothetical protein
MEDHKKLDLEEDEVYANIKREQLAEMELDLLSEEELTPIIRKIEAAEHD